MRADDRFFPLSGMMVLSLFFVVRPSQRRFSGNVVALEALPAASIKFPADGDLQIDASQRGGLSEGPRKRRQMS
jgi:hypothetical protein